jgi:transcriptional regulator with XRE-family HTH domain
VVLRIRFERLLRGWSQTDVAHLAHVMQQEVSLIEQGRLIPTPNQLERLGRAFGIPPASLLKPVAIVEADDAPTAEPQAVAR